MLTILYPLAKTEISWGNFNHKSRKLSINIKIHKVSPSIPENLFKNEASLKVTP
jgi:hypothetical protein